MLGNVAEGWVESFIFTLHNNAVPPEKVSFTVKFLPRQLARKPSGNALRSCERHGGTLTTAAQNPLHGSTARGSWDELSSME